MRPTLLAALALLAACSAGVGSIGAVLGRDNETHDLVVREVPPGFAADKAGLLPGDQILMIDGVYARDLDIKALHEKLRGDVGSPVELTIVRGRDVIRVKLARTRMLDEARKKPPAE